LSNKCDNEIGCFEEVEKERDELRDSLDGDKTLFGYWKV
jgi:hypothetical protein